MPASATQRKNAGKARRTAPRVEPSPRGKPVIYEVVGLILIALGVTLILTQWLHGSQNTLPSALLFGAHWLFGIFGTYGVSLALIALGVILLIHLSGVEMPASSLGMTMIFLVVISLVQLCQDRVWDPRHFSDTAGGALGGLIAGGMARLMGKLAWLPLVFLGLGGIALLTDTPLWQVLAWPVRIAYRLFIRPFVRDARARREAARMARVAALQEDELHSRVRRHPEVDFGESILEETAARKRKQEPPVAPVILPPEPVIISPPEPVISPEEPPAKVRERVTGVPSSKPDQLQFADDAVTPASNRPYNLPPVDLLSYSAKPAKPKKDDVEEKIAVLETTLKNFGIEAKVVAVERGPRVTRFELVPPPGIRVNRITNLADDLALSLAALDVRVEAPVPGKGVVGIEVPNKEPVIVDVREIVESEAFQRAKTPLNVALGRDIAGHPRCADLTRMPHLLIAGATNSGKSVCINVLICSILMRATPQQVKFLMVDPKRVELSLFQSIPHLIAPVAYDAKHAAGLLRWAIREMEQRYEMFAEKGVRNIIGFNEQSILEGLEELPYIVIIIDELADLMMQAAAEFEASICRLAQLARATGIHLVIATQRPSVNVITGTIKANVPSRIAFAVASQVDSRTILDMNGAERLVGMGDMLYLPVDASKPSRIQGAYVSEKDINRIVEYVKTQGKPNFTDEIMAIEEEAIAGENNGGGFSDEPEDELFQKALDYIRSTKYASTSMLQRKFRIGYTRAARIMDLFEERGYVGPGQGSKPREVIFAPSSSVAPRAAAPAEEKTAGSLDDVDEDDIFGEG